jgi:hypothetical protein
VTDPNGGQFASGGFTTQGEQYRRAAEYLIRRNAGWAVAQGWERFETFLKDISAAFLAARPTAADPTKIAKHIAQLKSKTLPAPTTPAEWGHFVRKQYHGQDNAELFAFLRNVAPSIVSAETTNRATLGFARWYAIVAKVRHAATHSDDVIPKDKLAEIDAALLESSFHGSRKANGYNITLQAHDAEQALNRFADYGFLIYKALSQKERWEWDVLGKGRTIIVRFTT